MQVRYSSDPIRFKTMKTAEVRDTFLLESIFLPDNIEMVYCDIDRAICGGAVPVSKSLTLATADQLRADYFCQRRELGILNIGGPGKVTVDETQYDMATKNCLYVGLGSKTITFSSDNSKNPAQYYLLSFPAHKEYPTTHIPIENANKIEMGSLEQANKRTIYQFIHPAVVKSCQLAMGFTELAAGSVWNTMPPHTHQRRMEIYLYFDMADDSRVFHFMGEPDETRHIAVGNCQAVVSPSWSIHSGVGTSSYTFCWGMGGENQTFDDMDHLAMSEIL